MRTQPRISAVVSAGAQRAGAFAILIILSVLGHPALGQNEQFDLITGRDFAGIDFPLATQHGDALIEARAGWAWEDGESRRLLLDGDVRVRIGQYDLVADRASLWVEPRTIDGERQWQLAFYFADVRTPLASARFSQAARRLLVSASVSGQVRLRVDLLEDGRPFNDEFLLESEDRLARRLSDLLAQGAPQLPAAGFDYVDRSFFEPLGAPAPLDPNAPIFPNRGVITLHAPDRTFITGDEENALVVSGGVVVQYADLDADRTLQLTAQNAVIFLDPGAVADIVEVGPGDVRGIYLEGNVIATDGQFTIRGPRVFYDVRNDRAAVLDAVFYAYDDSVGMPIYVRADVIRQEALGQWQAQNAKLANVGFANPQLSIGSRDVRISQDRRKDGTARVVVDAKKVSLGLGDTPVLPIPRIRGDVERIRVPNVRIGSKNGDPVIQTKWDLGWMLNLDSDTIVEGDLLLDGYFGRGPAGGLELQWQTDDSFGRFLGYYIYDEGEDLLSTGATVAPQDKNRGLVLAEHQWNITEKWNLKLEGAYISDPAFADSFFEGIAEVGRETTNRLALSHRTDQGFFLFNAQSPINDFTPNEYLLQSRGYQVQKYPEISYSRLGDSFFGGRLTYSSENSVGVLGQSFNEPPVQEYGFITPALSQAAFGINPGQSIADRLRAQGYTEDAVARLDSRHEFRAPLDVGPVRITPFAVGRLTLYSDDFSEFRAANGFTDDESSRLWGSAGVTFSTSFNRVYNGVSSKFWNLNRLRHIIEPSATIWTAASNIDSESLPVYDESVESLAEGTAFRVGVTSTMQTKRGGPGAWRNVDWLVLRAEYVYATDDTTRESAVGRFFESRPELSRFGQFAAADAQIQLTDAVGVVGSAVYDTENSELDTASAGLIIDHGFGFTTFAEVRRIDAGVLDSTFLNVGGALEISERYALAAAAVLDIEQTELQALGFEVRRRFPQWTLEIGVDYDDLRDDVSFSIGLKPWGGPTDRVRNSLSRERFSASELARKQRGSAYQP